MNKTCVTTLACLLLCASLLCSCVSSALSDSPPPQTVQESWGTKTIYTDSAGYVVRIEKRGTNNDFLPGACIAQFSYDNGERVEKQNLNSQGSLVCNDEGYAIKKYAYQLNPGQQPVVEETFYDQNNRPVVTKSGFAMMTCTGIPGDRVYAAHLSDFLNKPAPSVWFGVSNVVDVQYFYLQGVTPIVCGVFRDGKGNMIERKQLKGFTSQVVVQADDDSDYDVPVYTGESHHDNDHDSGFHGGHH